MNLWKQFRLNKKTIRVSKWIIILILLFFVGGFFVFSPQLVSAENIEDISIEKAQKQLSLGQNKSKKILLNLTQPLTDEILELPPPKNQAVIALVRKAIRQDFVDYMFIDMPFKTAKKIIKAAVEISRMWSGDASVVLSKLEEKSVEKATEIGINYLLRKEIKTNSGAIEVSYDSYKNTREEVLFQYIIIYKQKEENKVSAVIRFYSKEKNKAPKNQGSFQFGTPNFVLNEKIPPFIAEISGDIEINEAGGYSWVDPNVEINFPDNVPDLGLRPKSFWERNLLDPFKRKIRDLRSILFKGSGKVGDFGKGIWGKLRDIFSQIQLRPAAVSQVTEDPEQKEGQNSEEDIEQNNEKEGPSQAEEKEEEKTEKTEKTEQTEKEGTSTEETTTTTEERCIPLNSATKQELDKITYIGPATAQKIIDFRKDNQFYLINDLTKISGIGDKTINKIKEQDLACVKIEKPDDYPPEELKKKEEQSTSTKEQVQSCIPINSAPKQELDKITYIGPATAQKIIDFRENTKIYSLEELEEISGIGPKTIEEIKKQDLACVKIEQPDDYGDNYTSTGSNSSSNEQENNLSINFNTPIKATSSKIINATVTASNLKGTNWDIKISIQANNSCISKIYNKKEEKWQSSYSYIKNYFSGSSINKEKFKLKLKEEHQGYEGEAQIILRLRENGESSFHEKSNSILLKEEASENKEKEINLSYSPEKLITEDNITFRASSSISELVYHWNFGNGTTTTSTNSTTSYSYTKSGTYTVELLAKNEDYNLTATSLIEIYSSSSSVTSSKLKIDHSTSSFVGEEVEFKINSNLATTTTYYFNFGDKATTTTTSLKTFHTYSTSSIYTINLLASSTNSTSTCTSSIKIKEKPDDFLEPSVSFKEIEKISSSSLNISWEGDDSATSSSSTYISGIKGYKLRFKEKGKDWTYFPKEEELTSSTSLSIKIKPDIKYLFEIKAEDKVGNISDWVSTSTKIDLPKTVVINEIAWMGTATSSWDEWIELYNNSSSSINLKGWSLEAKDGNPKIEFSTSTIKTEEYYLLEKDEKATNIESNFEYGGRRMNDEGEKLVLKDKTGTIIDAVSFKEKWPSGTKDSHYQSMERINSASSGSLASNWANNNRIARNGKDADNNKINGTPGKINSVSRSSTTVGFSHIKDSLTFTYLGSPYIIKNDLTINKESKVDIELGVKMKFRGYTKLTVKGDLKAKGEEDKRIYFEPYNKKGAWDKILINGSSSSAKFNYVTIKNLAGKRGDYYGMEIHNSSTTFKNTIITKPGDLGFSGLLVDNSTSTFSNVKISGFKDREGDYGEFETALSIENSNVEIDNSTIEDNYKGLVIEESNFSLTNNNFINNNEEPVFIRNSFPKEINNNSFSNNRSNGIFIESLWFKKDQISFSEKTPYIINRTLTIPENKKLKIKPGSIIKFNAGKNASIKAEGIIEAEGEENKPIIFTALRDNLEDIANEYGEEYKTNTDSSSNSATPGSWGNIFLKNNESTSTFNNVIVRYGGRISNAVTITSKSALEIGVKAKVINSIFESNLEGRLFIAKGAKAIVKDNVFKNNNSDKATGIWTAKGLIGVSNNEFINNDTGFYFPGGDQEVCKENKSYLGTFTDNGEDVACYCCIK